MVAQCMLFRRICFDADFIFPFWQHPTTFISTYVCPFCFPLFIASFVFLSQRRWWAIVFSFIFAIWCLANTLYFRNNNLVIDAYAISMTGNLKGFVSSVFFLLRIQDILFFIPTIILYIFILRMRHKQEKRLLLTFFGISTSAFLFVISALAFSSICYIISKQAKDFIKFSDSIKPSHFYPFAEPDISNTYEAQMTSIFHSAVRIPFELKKKNLIKLTDKEQKEIDKLICFREETHTDNKLIIIIVESLESWVIQPEIMPNLYGLIQSNNTLFVPDIKSQTKAGNSADGQMIINTGLLPLNEGVACMNYAQNIYPSIMENIDGKKATILPHPIDVWNQNVMSKAYHYDTTFCFEDSDKILFKNATNVLKNGYTSAQIITVSTHMPFNSFADSSKIILPNEMPKDMANYIKSFNYMDEGLQIFITEISSNFSNSNIIITADHKVFPDDSRKKMSDLCKKYNWKYNITNPHIPLIIHSPKIDKHTTIQETCYQMDIYPTILHLMECENYYWKGFGVNLLNNEATKNRSITEEKAYELSDKIIRSNYFYTYKQQ